jgi:Calcineurin-like phosphoesterase
MGKRPTHHNNPAAKPVGRYALPSFSHSAAEAPASAAESAEQVNWQKGQLGPVPPVQGDGTIQLESIIGAAAVAEIEQIQELRFQSVGDSGVGHAEDAEEVANEMATDFKAGSDALNPAFLFHLGDVIYGPNKTEHYGERFYRPYKDYPGKILAIPGNHDGEAKSAADEPSLKAFQENFCALEPTVPEQAKGSGIFRETMTLPGVYWMLDAPYARIVALYSNRLENQGYLEGKTDAGAADLSQRTWLEATLKKIAAMPKKALIIAAHHPPYSLASHPSSPAMTQEIDAACQAAGLWPDAFLSGHAHNYQFHLRRTANKQIPYFVAGTGGIQTQRVPPATGQPTDGATQVTYEKAVASLGYLFVTVTPKELKVEFWQLGDEHVKPFNAVTVDLGDHTVASV